MSRGCYVSPSVWLAAGHPVPSGACVLRAIVEAATYDEFISGAVKVAEAIGAAIMILGGLAALVGYVVSMARSPRPSDALPNAPDAPRPGDPPRT